MMRFALVGGLLLLAACGAAGAPEPVREGITAEPVRIDISGTATIGVTGGR
ncbi:hypothetical protein [Palleronia rufa]|uniref:hypothetical protein n=1 Tax=Palleronia rufa TaxID=1530186 RepID=UPI00190FB86C|nr:hypothetical protein [Palleronia rufa]